MAEMIDGHYDAVDIYGSEMEEVNSKLHEARSFDEIKNVIELFLLKKVNGGMRLKTEKKNFQIRNC